MRRLDRRSVADGAGEMKAAGRNPVISIKFPANLHRPLTDHA